MHHGDTRHQSLRHWANDQLKPDMEGDQACFQCHQSHRDNIAGHTHHPLESAGSRCQNCHMPHTTYGLLKGIRSHLIDSPSVAASVETGRPNACNQCHLDKSLGWTQQHLSNWYGHQETELTGEQQEISATLLNLLRGDAGLRALAAWSMGWKEAKTASGERWLSPYLAHLLDDPYAAVRYIGQRSLKRLPGYEELEYDFVGPPSTRAQTRRRLLERWFEPAGGGSRENSAGLDRYGPQILFDSQGQLDRAAFERLAGQRDDRPVDLAE
jgi:hypothetical protein